MKLVYVEWLDAQSGDSGWRPLDTIKAQKPALCRSVGWLLAETEEHITLVASLVDNEGGGDVTIPKAWIKGKIKPLRIGR